MPGASAAKWGSENPTASPAVVCIIFTFSKSVLGWRKCFAVINGNLSPWVQTMETEVMTLQAISGPSPEKLSGHRQAQSLTGSSLSHSGFFCHSRFPQRPGQFWQRHVRSPADTQWMLSRQYSLDVLHDYFLSGSIWLNKAEIKSYKCAEKILINV